jgi:ketosteroid isomerase-like protein
VSGTLREVQELRALNARFIHNFVTNDATSHAALIHPRFVCLSSAGARVDRATYLRKWSTGFSARVIPYWDVRDESIDVFGDLALVRASNKYVLRGQHGDATHMSTYTDTYVRENGQWRCVQAQITDVAPAHWPADHTIISRYIDGVLQR